MFGSGVTNHFIIFNYSVLGARAHPTTQPMALITLSITLKQASNLLTLLHRGLQLIKYYPWICSSNLKLLAAEAFIDISTFDEYLLVVIFF